MLRAPQEEVPLIHHPGWYVSAPSRRAKPTARAPNPADHWATSPPASPSFIWYGSPFPGPVDPHVVGALRSNHNQRKQCKLKETQARAATEPSEGPG